MDVIGVIPARYKSTRFPGKVLAEIFGKPMIQYVWEKAKQARLLDDLIVAADDERVLKAALNFGAKAVSTAKEQSSGTDRIAEVVNPLEVKIVLNIQADEPLIHPSMLDKLAGEMLENPDLVMATLIKRIDDDEQLHNPNVVKVVADKDGFALYFSRSPIPYTQNPQPKTHNPIYKHIGIYAYTKDFLFTFKNLPPSVLEEAERLEQLRALEYGYKIKLIETDFDTIGVDRPEDLERVKKELLNEQRDSHRKD